MSSVDADQLDPDHEVVDQLNPLQILIWQFFLNVVDFEDFSDFLVLAHFQLNFVLDLAVATRLHVDLGYKSALLHGQTRPLGIVQMRCQCKCSSLAFKCRLSG